MKSKILSLAVIFFVILCVQSFAQTQNEKLNQIRNLINDSERRLNLISDWNDKIKIYNKVISEVENAYWESTNDELDSELEKILNDWEDRRWKYIDTINNLYESLVNSMERRAIDMSKARHSLSEIDEVTLTEINNESRGGYMYITATYKIELWAYLLGIKTVGSTDNVTVKGQINMRNNTMQVTEANIQ
jgi:hypothetical protein